MNTSTQFLGDTVQLYTTNRCNMACLHCMSRKQSMPDMSLATFRNVVATVGAYGAKRIELFANDPLLHPDIMEQVAILNSCALGYAVLTVGASRGSDEVGNLFWRVADQVRKGDKGGFVFSVDHTEETALAVLEQRTPVDSSYAFKALTFWRYVRQLVNIGIPVRINVVISRYNIDEVVLIIRQAVEMGVAASFCFVQYQQPKFLALATHGLTPELKLDFRQYMAASGLLTSAEMDGIIRQTREICARGKLKQSKPFNCFRGSDADEGRIALSRLEDLRLALLELKRDFPTKVLPGEKFINGLGERWSGCIGLLQQSRYPQMKIGSGGEILFCCDMHDPLTGSYNIRSLGVEGTGLLLESLRTNPYIWLCTWCDACEFSINHVVFDTKKGG